MGARIIGVEQGEHHRAGQFALILEAPVEHAHRVDAGQQTFVIVNIELRLGQPADLAVKMKAVVFVLAGCQHTKLKQQQ